MRQRAFPALIWVLLLLLISGLPGLAQSYRARIQGTISDQTEAIIPGATVTLLNVNTGVSVVRQSSETGLYLFDLVDPGTYTLTVESPGFNTFIQENVAVQMRGDVTVNVTLTPGAVQESITVTDTPVAVSFNSANKDFTLDSRLTEEIPRIDRNPFKLTLLAPSSVNTRGEMMPFHSWAANSVDLGGGTNLKNDLQVDGSPIGLGHKNSYPPNTDAVQEVVVSQNAVDAESGHSAGGLITMTTKSGTNDWHGTGFYLGRYPWINAESDRTRHNSSANRQHMFGGTIGNPILKNKLFNFFSLEVWQVRSPATRTYTMPTGLERGGDFSQSQNIDGGLRTIYDPWSTQLDPNTGAITRTPFAGNIIPSSSIDPFAASLMNQFWDPNRPGVNITNANNFIASFTQSWNYYNFSDRVDYNISDNWKVFGRVSRYHTTNIDENPTPNNSALFDLTGTLREANQVAADAVWTVNPSTVVNFHGGWHNVVDAYVSDDFGTEGWDSLWPGNPWYKNYHEASTNVPIYFPRLTIGGQRFGGRGFYWNQKPKGMDFNAKISKQKGSHYIKAGLEHRRRYGATFVGDTSNFQFPAALSAESFVSPDVIHNGDGYASFLLGGLDSSSYMIGGPAPDPHDEYWGMFIQDDWKVNQWLTINLGLRNEYETAWHDPDHNFSRGMDLSQPVPEMQANPPQMPQEALDLVGNSFYRWNGQWLWTDNNNPGMWNPPKLALAPRVGAAIRINDKTALRVGYARYVIPTEMTLSQAPVSGFETVSFLEPPFFGMKVRQDTAGLIEGVPQQRISDPYPSDSNPLLPIIGKGFGSNLGRGGAPLLWYPRDPFKKATNDRININFQHQLPEEVVVSATWLYNIGNQHYTRMNLNTIDPRLQQEQQNAINVNVDNPFYNYLTPELFPGSLRNQQTVSLSSLLVPYAHYGGLYEVGTLGAAERYHSIELKAQKAFSRGWNFLFAYVYIREKTEAFHNELDEFLNSLSYLNSNQPRHRVTSAGSWELPFGNGRPYLNNMPKAADAIVGGWKVTGLFTYMSGAILRFGKMNYDGSDPTVSNPTPGQWFNTSAFSPIASGTYVIRSNPQQFDNLTGPNFWVLDATLAKTFNLTERFQAELKMAAYNATNHLNRGNPNLNVNNSLFGTALYQGSPAATFGPQTMQLGSVSGRQVELGLKLIF